MCQPRRHERLHSSHVGLLRRPLTHCQDPVEQGGQRRVDGYGFQGLVCPSPVDFLRTCGGHEASLEAGANLESAMPKGSTPLHLASEQGHPEVVSGLLEAGANPNSRGSDGATPLYGAAHAGRLAAVKVLLRAKANPLLAKKTDASEVAFVPLDVAARNGHSEVARELLHQFGVDGCAGESGGGCALGMAAMEQQIETMAVLMDAGVVDTGMVLTAIVRRGHEALVKYLLQRQQQKGAASCKRAYVNTRTSDGETPLVGCIGASLALLRGSRGSLLTPKRTHLRKLDP